MQLQAHLDLNKVLEKFLSGFKSHYSTEMSLLNILIAFF